MDVFFLWCRGEENVGEGPIFVGGEAIVCVICLFFFPRVCFVWEKK